MAKAMEYIIELNDYEAEAFLDSKLHPKPNKARDELIRRAKELNIEFRP